MKKQRLAWSGWVVAAGLLGIMLGSGFQAPTLKLGAVNVNIVIDKSEEGKSTQKQFQQMKLAREGVLQFMDDYRVLTTEQAIRLRELSIKLERTKQEEAESERIKSEVIAASKKSKELAIKANLTPEDRTLVEEYSRRSTTINDLANRWLREFTDEVQTFIAAKKEENLEKAKAAINEVAAKEGYTMVIESSVAVYGANDLTDQSLAAMNAKKP